MKQRAIPDDIIITIYEYAAHHNCSVATAAHALGYAYTAHELNWRAAHLRQHGVHVPVLTRNPRRRGKVCAPAPPPAPTPAPAPAPTVAAVVEPDAHALRPVAWAVEMLGLSLAAASVMGARCPVMPESVWRRMVGRQRRRKVAP